MRIANIRSGGAIVPAVSFEGGPYVALRDLDPVVGDDPFAALAAATIEDGRAGLRRAYDASRRYLEEPDFGPACRRPRKILGIGLNYRRHAADLGAELPTSPASFLKGDHTIVGPGDAIILPALSQRVTSEAELALVIGRPCFKVSPEEALDCILGVVPVLDQTAEDILMLNPRFLTRAKNFPTFLSIGPEIVTLDELSGDRDLADIEVETRLNGSTVAKNVVANMTFGLRDLVSFHSQVMPFFPGDVISTGTPGAVVIRDGDLAECWINGVGQLLNPVVSDTPARVSETPA